MMTILKYILLPSFIYWCAAFSYASEVIVAVAGNFYKPMQQISAKFEQQTGHKVQLSVGSTGKLFAQIVNGAPFELFLAADQRRPLALIELKLALAGSNFTYAKGKLALWSPDPQRVDASGSLLSSDKLKHIAIANPKTAPYGAAAISVLKNMQLYELQKTKLIEGQNIGQTYQQLVTGNVQQGFVALSQIFENGKLTAGSAWIVPRSLYKPIKQDAILLKQGDKNPVAYELLRYLQGDDIKTMIRSFGYEI